MIRLTLFPTSSLLKKRSMLAPIFSYPGTGAWMSASTFPSLSEGSKPEGKQHAKATQRWPSGVSRSRKRSSSTVSARIRRARRGSEGGEEGWVVSVRVLVNVSGVRVKRVG